MSRQTKLLSALESILNVGTGMILAFTISSAANYYEAEIQRYIYSDFNWDISLTSNLIVTTTLTIVSFTRGYIWRRIFNRRQGEL